MQVYVGIPIINIRILMVTSQHSGWGVRIHTDLYIREIVTLEVQPS